MPLAHGTQAGRRHRRSGRGEDGAYDSQNPRVERHPHRLAGRVRSQHRGPGQLAQAQLPRSRVNSGATRWRVGSLLVDVGVLVVLTSSLGVYYLHAAALAFSAGLLTSYGLSIAWVFQARTWQHPWVEFGLFTLIGGLGLLWCSVCMWVLTEYAHLHYLYSKLGAALVVFLWNFVAKKWLLFHR